MDQFLHSLYQQFDLLRAQNDLLQQNIKGISDLILLNGGTIPVHEKSKLADISKHVQASSTSTSSHEHSQQIESSSHDKLFGITSSHVEILQEAASSHVQSELAASSHETDDESHTSSLKDSLRNTSSHVHPIKRDTSSHQVAYSTTAVSEIPEKITLEKVDAPIPDLFSQPSPLPPHTTYEEFLALQKTPVDTFQDMMTMAVPPAGNDDGGRSIPAMYQVPKEYNEKMMWTEKILYALNELRLPATAHQVASAIHELEPNSNLSIEKSVELTTSRMFKSKLINAKKEKNKNYYYLYYYSK